MRRILALLAFAPLASAQMYPYTDVLSNNSIALTNKTFDCNLNTCLHFSGGSVGANPTAVVGAAVVNGVATTFMRSDAAPPIDLTFNPTWTGTHTFNGTVAGTALSTYLASPPAIGGTAPAPGAFTTIGATGQITSTLTTGTAPFSIASATNVANLNASSLNGATFASPGSIGSGTPGSGAFTTLTSSSGIPLTSLATQATNTVLGNGTSGTAVPTALAVGTCSTAGSALNWTTNTGFGCNTAIDSATLLSGTWAIPGSIGATTPNAGAFTTLSSTSAPTVNGIASSATLFNWGIVVGAPPSGSFPDNNGTYVVGQVPSASATCEMDRTANGAADITCSAATLLNTAADVGRVFTINDSGTYRYFTITTQKSTTAANGTISNGPFTAIAATISGVAITGVAGQFSCTCTGFVVGMGLTLSGTYGGTGSITGYANPTTYYVSATNGTSTFTLQSAVGTAIVTTAGTPTGITYTPVGTATFANANIWLSGTPTTNTSAFSVPLPWVFPKAYFNLPLHAMSGSSAAGVYYATCVSTTVCTIYTTTLASGIPTIPNSPVAFTSTSPGAFSQVTSGLTLLTLSIPANSMGTQGSLVWDLYGNRNSSAGTVALQTFYAGTQTSQLSVVSVVWYGMHRTLRNIGATNAQMSYLFSASAAPTDVTTNNNPAATTLYALDTTQAQNFVIKSIASTVSTDWFFLQGGTIVANYTP